MRFLSRISVGAKLACLVATLVFGLAVLAATAFATLNDVLGRSEQIAHQVGVVRALGDMRGAAGNLRRYEKDMFLNLGSEADLQRYHATWRKEFSAGRALLDRLGAEFVGAERNAAERMGQGLAGYGRAVESVVERITRGQITEPNAANKALEPAKGDIRNADKAFGELTDAVLARVDAQLQNMAALRQRSAWVMASATVGVLLGSLLLATLISRRITQPLQRTAQAVERVAGGDLSGPVVWEGNDETARVAQGVARMQQALVRMISQLREGIAQVATASTEIASGNVDLSARTERQAASLQQTAASMEQLTATVRSSADHAQQASRRAQAATRVAEAGGGAVRGVVDTMSGIEAASRRIGEITGVIDGIAFQTNILALNAAVEAARAGEEGRGFAVVAGEVRSLAQRSAEAARQIKALIGESAAQVQAGSEQVRGAGSTIESVVTEVRAISGLLQQIASAGGEQSQGITQVGAAVSQLDQVTQQNAALVEQTTAASESLKQQSRRLTEAVAVFRLGDEAAA
jgi:methyl-accepting chemotaxis protein